MTSMDDIEQNKNLVESNHLFSESDVGCQNNSAEDIFDTTDEQIVNNRTSSVDDKDGRKRRTEAGAIMLPSPKKHKIGHKSNFVSMVIDEAETDQEHVIDGQDKKYNDIIQHGDIEVDRDINEQIGAFPSVFVINTSSVVHNLFVSCIKYVFRRIVLATYI
jgi:hypothetical protein